MFDFSNGTAFIILTKYLDMKRVSDRLVPCLLTEEEKAKRVRLPRAFLRQYTNGDGFLQLIAQLTKHCCTITIPKQSNSPRYGTENHHQLPSKLN